MPLMPLHSPRNALNEAKDKVPTNESNIFRGEEVDVLFMTHLSNCEAYHPLGIC